MGVKIASFDADSNLSKKKSFDIDALLKYDIKISNPYSLRWKESFYSELASLLESGIDIKNSLNMLSSTQSKQVHKELLELIQRKLVSGLTLSDSLRSIKGFTSFEFYSVQIGEETGKLKDVLQDLATHFSKQMAQRRKIISALSYPALIIATSIAAVIFMLIYMVPMFGSIFSRFGGELPTITKRLVDFSGFVSSNFWFLSFSFALVISLLIYLNRYTWYKEAVAKLIVKLPLLGDVYRKYHSYRFCSLLGLMVVSKVPLIQSMELIIKAIDFYPLQKALPQVKEDLIKGGTLSRSLEKIGWFENKIIMMLKIGEETGKIDEFLSRVTVNLQNEIDHRTDMLNTFLEPLLILFLGVLVGFILISMYLPMFQISSGLNF